MTIETHAGGTMVTGEHIEMLRLMTLRSALGLEIRTGMVRSNRGRSTLAIVNDVLPRRAGTKRNAYAALNKLIVKAGGTDRPL